MRCGARHSSAEPRDWRLRRASTWPLTSSSVSPECCCRRGGGVSNVHTLGGLRTDNDAERDDSSVRYWNGNSTQFGGDPADDDAADAPMDGFYTSRNE